DSDQEYIVHRVYIVIRDDDTPALRDVRRQIETLESRIVENGDKVVGPFVELDACYQREEILRNRQKEAAEIFYTPAARRLAVVVRDLFFDDPELGVKNVLTYYTLDSNFHYAPTFQVQTV